MPALTMGWMEMHGEKNTPQAGGSVEIGVNGGNSSILISHIRIS
jgi:hypothetical protein